MCRPNAYPIFPYLSLGFNLDLSLFLSLAVPTCFHVRALCVRAWLFFFFWVEHRIMPMSGAYCDLRRVIGILSTRLPVVNVSVYMHEFPQVRHPPSIGDKGFRL